MAVVVVLTAAGFVPVFQVFSYQLGAVLGERPTQPDLGSV